MSINRLTGGLIDHNAPVKFSFDGNTYEGRSGDTLASALLANGVRLMGRSFKYHRPRGVVTAGSEEPNALVQLRTGGRQEPNTRATTIELFNGLTAKSQNRLVSLKFDALGINDIFHNFLAAGFYYKTFMWPRAFWEKLYEPVIRNAAGLGNLSLEDDPDCYDKGFLHCDLLIVGAGPAGLAAALTAGRAGARVILAEEDFLLGGRLLAETGGLTDMSAADWLAVTQAELAAMDNVRIMPRTTVVGAYDHGIYGALERVADHVPIPESDRPRQIFWRIYAKQAVVCAGGIERPISFENNDRPGVMLAGAVRAYVNRWAVTPAQSVVVFTNNDDGHRTARDLIVKGVSVPAVIDVRVDACASAGDIEGTEVLAGAQIVDTKGRLGIKSVTIRLANGQTRVVPCGAVAVSGGWNPNLGLTCHQRGRPVWNDTIHAFVPGADLPVGQLVAGAANGVMSTHGALKSGAEGAVQALANMGIDAHPAEIPRAEDAPLSITPFWHVKGAKRAWVDFQNDVTVKDIRLAHQEGFRSVEHLKRYTTLGMATDQGKTANLTGLAVMAELTGKTIPETGATIFRPPYTPVAMGALAGRAVGREFHPTRLTPSHKWAKEQGAEFVEVGNWLRAQYFPRSGETNWRQSVDREVLATRRSVGVCDVTTLGKIDVQGAHAATFLNKIYANGFGKLPVGKVRYGVMLREDGVAYDDGTAARLAEDHFVVTTTTANAVLVYRNMEFARQCLWPDLDVQLVSTTEAWAQYAVAGPNSRKVLQKIVDATFDISNDAFPFMACGEITVCGGLRARLFRISFSGELAYEIAVPTQYGDALMRRLIEEGAEYDITPYGTEALGVMRIEKGHAAGAELNGTTTASNLGLGRMVSKKKDCIGNTLSERDGMALDGAMALVGLKPTNGDTILAGAHLMNLEGPVDAAQDQGYVTSAAYSPVVKSSIGLSLLKDGSNRMGETLRAISPLDGSDVLVQVVSAHFVDPDGGRLRD
ncbi:sarcosine oxidase subunit alpha family protein [Shimia sp.]|uniref:sarcosine oxidase subunit alpha family protein n=1 Tax=Shimia sp. TaxID=1954381 RepID=UPI003B8E86D7